MLSYYLRQSFNFIAINLIVSVANGGGADAMFTYLSGLFIDASGNISIGEGQTNTLIRKIAGATATTGIACLVPTHNIKLYPIPASNQLTLEITLENRNGCAIELINSEGIKVASTVASHYTSYQQLNIPVQSLPEGLYIATIYSGDQITSQKIIIAR